MQTPQERHYKEQRPEETTAYLKEILRKLGIEIEENPAPKSGIDTYSMRVTIKGTGLGANGKGVTEDYMKASAYAELFERLQNGHINPWGLYGRHGKGFWHCPDERYLTSLEIAKMAEIQSFLKYYFDYKGLLTQQVEIRAENFKKLHRVEFYFGHGRDSYEARPFFSVKRNCVEYIPYFLYLSHYASNGMCAGNTPEEALVQGFSEIMERHVQKRIFQEKPCLPSVPNSYIKKYPYVWERIEKLRQLPGIRAYMKDGSFGGRYPAAVLLLVNENTGGFGVKLGCHPDFGIAMERTLTEATQGAGIREYASRSSLDFYNRDVDTDANIYSSYKYGEAQYPYELFGDESTYPFTPGRDVSRLSNRRLLEEMTKGFLAEGYDILIRDVSYLGFPSYQMLIPGFSELQTETDLKAKVYNTRVYLAPYLAYPERIKKDTAKLLLGLLDYWSDSPMENQISQIYCIYPDFEFPAEDLRMGWLYLSAMCSVMLEQYGEAAGKILRILTFAQRHENSRTSLYRGLYYYLTLRDTGKPHNTSISFLEKFFDRKITEFLDKTFINIEEILVKQYKRYDYQGIYGNPQELTGECAVWARVREKLLTYQAEHPIDQNRVREIFQGMKLN